VRQPLRGFVETAAFEGVKSKVADKLGAIVHLYGIPGSGKTEIVRNLAQKFPFGQGLSTEEFVVKHEVNCNDGCEDIVDSLNILLEEMLGRNLIDNRSALQAVCTGLNKSLTQPLVDLLARAAIPVMLIIQDPPEHYRLLLDDLAASIRNKQCCHRIHVYVTSNNRGAFSNLSPSEEYEVVGMTEVEGLKILDISCNDPENEQKSATAIIESLSGSPLGLISVKIHCKTTFMTYEEYLVLNPHLTEKSEFQTSNNSNHQQKRIFDAIIKLIETKTGMLDKLKTMAMFHHGGIPRRLIERVTEAVSSTPSSDPVTINAQNKQESGEFVRDLSNLGSCTIELNGKQLKSVTFHQVVFSAIRDRMKQENGAEFLSHLTSAILAVASVIHKDLRKQENLKFMKIMRPHIRSIIKGFEKSNWNAKIAPREKKNEHDSSFLIKMAIVHLYEVLGVVETDTDQKSAEESLKQGAQIVWDEVKLRTKPDVDFSVPTGVSLEPIPAYVTKIIKACVGAGCKMRKCQFDLSKYVSLSLHIKEEDVNFLATLSSDENLIQELRKISEYSLNVSNDTLRRVRQDSQGLMLDESKHCEIFFAERLISIVYSLGRVFLYDNDADAERRKKFSWIADLASALCTECTKVTGVKLLFDRLSATNQIAVRLKRTACIDADDKENILKTTRRMAEDTLQHVIEHDDVAFENGLRKLMLKNEFQELTILRFLVRIDAKLWPMIDENERDSLQQSSTNYHQDLVAKAMKNVDKWKQSPTCFVYGGKYLAARSQYDQAAQHFLKAFELDAAKGQKFKWFGWVCYNFARAVWEGKLQEYKQEAIKKCKEVLNSEKDISYDLTKKLQQQLLNLENWEN